MGRKVREIEDIDNRLTVRIGAVESAGDVLDSLADLLLDLRRCCEEKAAQLDGVSHEEMKKAAEACLAHQRRQPKQAR